jgi:hypothetical protein
MEIESRETADNELNAALEKYKNIIESQVEKQRI